MTRSPLDRGREAFERRVWGEAHEQLRAADRETPLDLDDLERLAIATYLLGRDGECDDVWERAHHECLQHDQPARAVRCAFWLAVFLMDRGEFARGGGWLGRARRILDEGKLDCVEQGYLLLPNGLQSLGEGDPAAAYATFSQAIKVGDRFGDVDLVTLGRLGCGESLIRLGEAAEGVALLDEAMVAATGRGASPMVAGIAYCMMIEACQETFDLARANEWTAALTRWCDAQPDLVPYRGQCLVHRAEVMQQHGTWVEALVAAEQARALLSDPPGQPPLGAAHYQHGELLRLRGDFAAAEEAYRLASDAGHPPYPGLAQLRLAQGQRDAADAAIRRVADETVDRLVRSRLLGPYVEIVLAAGDIAAGRAAADELSSIAGWIEAPFLRAVADLAQGSVFLAEGDAKAAGEALRGACTVWQRLGLPYQLARTRLLMGLACRELGDSESARLEFEAARRGFRQLGATPDVARVEQLMTGPAPATAPGGLSPREIEVLTLVATGRTNRSIAGELVLSEKTVARHVSNIFTKLGLSSRSAATAYAYEHGLV